MEISEVEKEGKKYCSFYVEDHPEGHAQYRRIGLGGDLKEKIISNVCLRSNVCVMCVCLSMINLGQSTFFFSFRYGALFKNYPDVLRIPNVGANSLLKGVGWVNV